MSEDVNPTLVLPYTAKNMKRVLVIGDVIADVYRSCVFKKECPDAPGVPAAVEESVERRPGGAANVAVNLASLSPRTQVDLIGVMDADLARVIKFTSHFRVDSSLCVWDHGLTKERIVVDGKFIVRVDCPKRVSEHHSSRVEVMLRTYLDHHDPDLIILSDYDGGTVSQSSLEVLLELRERLLVDTKRTDLTVFSGGGRRTLLGKFNQDEWNAALMVDHSPMRNFQYAIVTRGPDGAAMFWHLSGERDGTSTTNTMEVRGHSVPVVDVCGCGDTFLAAFASSLLVGRDTYSAMRFANAAGAAAVGISRTAVVDRDSINRILGDMTQ